MVSCITSSHIKNMETWMTCGASMHMPMQLAHAVKFFDMQNIFFKAATMFLDRNVG